MIESVILIASTYEARNDILKRMGFPSYRDYLDSDLWKSIRLRVIRRDKCFCVLCRRRGFQVHHNSYNSDALKGENIGQMHCICGNCHFEIEHDPKTGKKLSFAESVGLFDLRCGGKFLSPDGVTRRENRRIAREMKQSGARRPRAVTPDGLLPMGDETLRRLFGYLLTIPTVAGKDAAIRAFQKQHSLS